MLKSKSHLALKREGGTVCALILFAVLSCLLIIPGSSGTSSELRSSRLQTIRHTKGNVERIDYCNEEGKTVVAADKGYATCIIVSSGNTKLYTFLDEKGEQVSRFPGYYALLREYDDHGNNISTTYLDMENTPCVTAYGYATEKRIYNDEGQIISIEYHDAESKPVCTAAFGNGLFNEYDQNGNNVRSTFVDASKEPMTTEQGYSSIERKFYLSDGPERNKTESEFYFDEYGNPVALALGQYGVHKEYDENGLESVLTYLDAEGRPIANKKGYSTVKKTYYEDDSTATEQYFDEEGQPVSLSDGQYGIRKEKGQIVYLNQNGEETFNLKRLLYNHTWMAFFGVAVFLLVLSVTGKRMDCLLLFIYLMVIAYLTLLFREGDVMKQTGLLWQYRNIFLQGEARTEILRNIWLFIPLGAILWKLCPQKGILLVPVALSAGIEIIQYLTKTGFCDLDDVISNGIGCVIGFIAEDLFYRRSIKITERNKG